MRPRSTSATRVNAQGKQSKRILRNVAASSLNWPAYGWRQPSTRRPLSVSDLHLLACLVLRRDPGGVLLRASSPSIAARIHSRAMSNSFSRSSGLLACLASFTQSRANSSNSDPDDMGALRQVHFGLNNAVCCTEFHCGLQVTLRDSGIAEPSKIEADYKTRRNSRNPTHGQALTVRIGRTEDVVRPCRHHVCCGERI
jgi:hypothetical protein